MATVVNARDTLLQVANPRVVPIQLPANYTVPANQVPELPSFYDSAKEVIFKATAQLFQVPKVGATLPSSIDITATLKNIVGTPVFTVVDGTVTYSLNGNTITVLAGGLTSNTATFQVSVNTGSATYTDRFTIAKVMEGADGVVGFLTNESVVLAAAPDGTVTAGTLNASGGTFKVFSGIVDKTGDAAVTYSTVSSSGCTVSIAPTGVYSISAISADTATATFRAVFSGLTIDKVYSVAKAKAGVVGTNGAPGTRGNVNLSRAITGSVWLDSEAVLAISDQGFGNPINRDIVTLFNNAAGFSQSKFYDGSAWQTLDAYINGNLLVTGTVSAPAIAAGAITADKIAIGIGKNLLANSAPSKNATANWINGFQNTGLPFATTVPTYDENWNPRHASNVFVQISGTPAAGTVFDIHNLKYGTTYYPCVGGKRYEFSAYLSMHRCTGTVMIFWYNASGTDIGNSVGSVVNTAQQNTTSLADFSRSTLFATAPATAVGFRFAIRATCPGGQANPYIFCSMAYAGEAGANQTVFSPWSDGGVTQISGGQIVTDSLSAISANIGLLRTATSGQRTEFDANGIRVYDGNGTLRVRLGVY